ncbi:MAG: site-2 protease family protein [Eubacteriales bacterium]|nr:site-2 protease family protein [Clostridiales bacterium]MDY5732698.1 site-2 protease family protein [Eubacteriales bacterium]
MIRDFIDNPINAALYFLAFVVALTFHECSHALAAYKLGDPTARNMGRLTLNPLKHLDLMGTLLLLLVGFGWAKPVPVNPRNYRNPKRDDIIVSLAGITSNILLAFLATPIYMLTIKHGSNIALVVSWFICAFIQTNIVLALFNLIPISPLDGSHVLEDLLMPVCGPKPFLWLRQYGRYLLIVVLIALNYTGVLGTASGWVFNAFCRVFSFLD